MLHTANRKKLERLVKKSGKKSAKMQREYKTPKGIWVVEEEKTVNSLSIDTTLPQFPQLPTLIPSIVIDTFTLELYLKCILRIHNIEFPQIHYLKQLFGLISVTERKRILQIYEKVAGGDDCIKAIRKTDKKSTELLECIDSMDKGFQNWRYAFEQSSNPDVSPALPAVKRALRVYILEKNPSWEELTKGVN